MPDPFDARRYLSHLRVRWRLVAIAVAVALVISAGISLLLPARYTATVKLVIEPPAGGDPRAATVLSPIYLESLRSYEYFASSDRLFEQAAERFKLRAAGRSQPFEKLKREVLLVSVPRNTKVMVIAATVPDPKTAHDLALYIAEETVNLNRNTNRAGDDELITAAKSELQSAIERVRAAAVTHSNASARTPTPGWLRGELSRVQQIQTDVSRSALSLDLWGQEGNQDKVERLRKRGAELERLVASLEKNLAVRKSEIETAEAELKSARTACEQLEKRVREVEGMSGFRGERLNVIDPGVVPEQPSSPNIPLNLVAAAALGLIASLLYLTLDYSLRTEKPVTRSEDLWTASRP